MAIVRRGQGASKFYDARHHIAGVVVEDKQGRVALISQETGRGAANRAVYLATGEYSKCTDQFREIPRNETIMLTNVETV